MASSADGTIYEQTPPTCSSSDYPNPKSEEESPHDDFGWVLEKKKVWSVILDQIDHSLTTNSSVISHGKLNIDEILHFWGQVVWPVVFLTRLKEKTNTRLPIDTTDIDILRRSIQTAGEAETQLREELNIKIHLSGVYDDVLKSLEESRAHKRSFKTDKTIAMAALAIKNMQQETGIHFDDAHMQRGLNSINIVAHLSVDAVDSVDGVERVQFSKNDVASDVVVVSLQHFTEDNTTIFDHVLHETATSFQSPPPRESLANISRGILFSDLETGIACLAVSSLAELGAEIDEENNRLIIHKTSSFFDETFLGVLRPSEVNSIAFSRDCPWDPAPDCNLDFGW